MILVYPVPETGSTSYEVFETRNRRSYEALDGAGQHPGLYRVCPEQILCDEDVKDRCIVHKDDDALYADDNHLSGAGAKLVVEEIVELVK